MKFSIITASFNQGHFIRQTIESVLSQEGDFSLEYFVFDGGSADDTISVLKEYESAVKADTYPRRCAGLDFHWVSEKDHGQSHALNKGIKVASGDIVAFVSSDDLFEPGALAIVTETFKKDPALDLVYGDTYFLDEKTGLRSLYRSKQMDVAEMTGTLSRVLDTSAFYSRRIIAKAGPLDESLKYVMMYELLIRVLSHGRARYIEGSLSTFRLWEKSKTVSTKKRFIDEIDQVHKKHGLSVLNPKRVQQITSQAPFAFVRRHFPAAYTFAKRIFYKIFSGITYTKQKRF